MARDKIQDEKEVLKRVGEYFSNITPQLKERFYTESNRYNIPECSTIQEMETTLLKNIATVEYTFH